MAEILKAAGEKEWKDKLLANTQKALDLGDFGAPWFWVRNGEGKEEPFFGSDRYVVCGDACRKQGSSNFSVGFILCGGIWVYRSRILRLFLKGGRRLSCNFFNWGRIKSLMKLFVNSKTMHSRLDGYLLSFFQDRNSAPPLLQQIRFLPRQSLKLSDLEACFTSQWDYNSKQHL